MSNHSVLAPSSAARRLACPGSQALEAQYPQEESTYSKEGTAAHWVASEILHGRTVILGSTTENGEIVSQEMLDGAELYTSHICSILPVEFHDNLVIEQPINISSIHPACWGTPDCWTLVNDSIYIWDYKFGHGYVEVYENWQLIEYAAGILQYLTVGPETWITFFIVQPRNYNKKGPIREWKIEAAELNWHFEKLRNAEAAACLPKAKCFPSPECTYCKARAVCPTLQQTALTVADISQFNSPEKLENNTLGHELRYLQRAKQLLEARITGLEGEAISLLKNGKRIPFFTLEESNGREIWAKPVEEITALGEFYQKELAKPLSVVTPKQAIDAGIPAGIVRAYSEVQKGNLKLTPVNEASSKKIFNKK